MACRYNEELVQFYAVWLKFEQPQKRSMSGAKVVNFDPNAQVPNRRDVRLGLVAQLSRKIVSISSKLTRPFGMDRRASFWGSVGSSRRAAERFTETRGGSKSANVH